MADDRPIAYGYQRADVVADALRALLAAAIPPEDRAQAIREAAEAASFGHEARRIIADFAASNWKRRHKAWADEDESEIDGWATDAASHARHARRLLRLPEGE